jgi:hypothetical protein
MRAVLAPRSSYSKQKKVRRRRPTRRRDVPPIAHPRGLSRDGDRSGHRARGSRTSVASEHSAEGAAPWATSMAASLLRQGAALVQLVLLPPDMPRSSEEPAPGGGSEGAESKRRDDVALEVKSGCPKIDGLFRHGQPGCRFVSRGRRGAHYGDGARARRDGGGTRLVTACRGSTVPSRSPIARPARRTCLARAAAAPRGIGRHEIGIDELCRFSEMTTSRGRTFKAGAAVAAVATVGAIGAVVATGAAGAAVAATRAGRGGAGGAMLSSSQGVGSVAKSTSLSEPSSEL